MCVLIFPWGECLPFFDRCFLLQPLLKIREWDMFWHLTTLDLWPVVQSPVQECLVSTRQIRGVRSEEMRGSYCFHTGCLYTWRLVIRELICSWGGPAGKRTVCGKRTRNVASVNSIFLRIVLSKTPCMKVKKVQCFHKHKIRIKKSWAEPSCANVYLPSLNMQ